MALLLAFVTALCETIKDISAKKVSKVFSPHHLLFFYKLVSVILLFPLAIFQWKFEPSASTLTITLMDGFLNIFAFLFYLRAISLSPVSLVVPLLSFSPALLLITSPLMLGETPSPMGLLGILLIVVGSYILYMEGRGLFSPIKALFRERGARFMLLTVLLWSITANLDKMGTKATSPITWVFLINSIVVVGMGIWLYASGRTISLQNKNGKRLKFPIIMGVADAVGAVFQMVAITMTLVPYVISIKRLSVLMSVIAGTTYLKEGRIIQRISGTILMLAGSTLILLTI